MQKWGILAVFGILTAPVAITPVVHANCDDNNRLIVKQNGWLIGKPQQIVSSNIKTTKTFDEWKEQIQDPRNLDKSIKDLFIAYDGMSEKTVKSIEITHRKTLERGPEGVLINVHAILALKKGNVFVHGEHTDEYPFSVNVLTERPERIPLPVPFAVIKTDLSTIKDWKAWVESPNKQGDRIKTIFAQKVPRPEHVVLLLAVPKGKEGEFEKVELIVVLKKGYVFDTKKSLRTAGINVKVQLSSPSAT